MRTPRAANSLTRERRVTPGRPIRPKSQSRSAASFRGRFAPAGWGAALPVARKRCDHFTTEATLTPNNVAVARHERPDATDATTRSRRSLEYARGMPAGLLSGQQLESPRKPRQHPKPIQLTVIML